MEAYSLDLRERVLRAVDEGRDSREGIARTFGVTSRWIGKLVQRRRETGSIEQLPHAGGRAAKFTAERLERLQALEESRRHLGGATSQEPRPLLPDDDLPSLDQLGCTRKKRRSCPANKNAPM